MIWTSAISEKTILEDAIAECSRAIQNEAKGQSFDLAVAFISPQHESSYDIVPTLMAESLGARHLFGCSGGGVIGNGLEVEQRAAVSITAAVLPDVAINPFHLVADQVPDLDAGPDRWESMIGVGANRTPDFIIPSRSKIF